MCGPLRAVHVPPAMRPSRRQPDGPALGTLLDGRYRLDAVLGTGGMATVFRALDTATQRVVAVKVLRPTIATNPEAVARFNREGELLTTVDHPAIVGAEYLGQLSDGTVYLVMELLLGETLQARMERGPMDPDALAPIVTGVCAGLHAAHGLGVIHRDLKPANIYLCPDARGELQVKLLDFGISKMVGLEKLTATGEILGTPRYMSPEQLGTEDDLDARVDVYGLGVILYEALAGQAPFMAASPADLIVAILHGRVLPLRSLRAELSEEVVTVVARAMAVDREARYETALDLAEAYLRVAGGNRTAHRQARRGLATRVLGGHAEPPPAEAAALPAGSHPLAGDMPIGTFTALPQTPPPVEVEPPPPPSPSPPPPMPPTRETPRVMLDAMTAGPPPGVPAAASSAPKGSPGPPARYRPTAPMASVDEAVFSIPGLPQTTPRGDRRLAGVLLILGALLAGAVSAAVVVGVLHVLTRPQEAPDPARASDDGALDAAGPESEEAPEAADVPEPAEVQDGGIRLTTEAPASAPPPRRRTRVRSPPADTRTPSEAAARPDAGARPVSALRAAQAAARGGDYQRCVDLLANVATTGAPAAALRRRAECYERLGQRDRALRDYGQYCRTFRDDPMIGQVRAHVESLGGICR
jgi:serine/threonine protein kinase